MYSTLGASLPAMRARWKQFILNCSVYGKRCESGSVPKPKHRRPVFRRFSSGGKRTSRQLRNGFPPAFWARILDVRGQWQLDILLDDCEGFDAFDLHYYYFCTEPNFLYSDGSVALHGLTYECIPHLTIDAAGAVCDMASHQHSARVDKLSFAHDGHGRQGHIIHITQFPGFAKDTYSCHCRICVLALPLGKTGLARPPRTIYSQI
ncbi:uncharacterized protein BCR38DRAFT_450104 [Pseudomassariella vexata]|uniref:Uncharacterized protein n=1 Tax=Pseudomassariella vexata TaxID=1141098 RepID=A0A1Y2DDE7_9PEZI|nr:uncharacterized protein BCR38DRAFT_450104 [Pseudomassariella vexata]ORY57288.1 hypothetical protein BCR38DRAFT_450104 [Pseudomassariella vexata]